MNDGWIKLHRKFINSNIFISGDSYLIQLFLYCLLKANWEPREVVVGNQVVKLKRGQFVTGRKQLVRDLTNCRRENSKKFKKCESLYRRKLFLLQKLQSLTIKSTNKFTVVSITNYDKYQLDDQQMTIKRPTDDHQMTTTKNIKNIKNTKNIALQNFKNPIIAHPSFQKWVNGNTNSATVLDREFPLYEYQDQWSEARREYLARRRAN